MFSHIRVRAPAFARVFLSLSDGRHLLHPLPLLAGGAHVPVPADRSRGAPHRREVALLACVARAGVADSRAVVLVLRDVPGVEQALLKFNSINQERE